MFGILRFAFDLTTKVLPLFGNYFGIKFNLSKIDMVAVPDFGFSAMENWGLITFRLVLTNEMISLLNAHQDTLSKECVFNLN